MRVLLLRRALLSILFLLIVSRKAPAQWYVIDTLLCGPTIHRPVALAFVPGGNGSFFFTEKDSGRVRFFDPAFGSLHTFARLRVTGGNTEEGLLGIAVHPSFPDSPYIYVYLTSTRDDRANVLLRLKDSLGVPVRDDTLLMMRRPRGSDNTVHNGGAMRFGPDGKLYIAVGDYGDESDAQDISGRTLCGKILRLNPDGSIPDDNPFPGEPYWSYGHRNCFGLTFDRATGKMYATENGGECNDEVNRVPRGANMGWPEDGNCSYQEGSEFTAPMFVFPDPPLPSLAGIAVYRGSAFPRMKGRLLFAGNSIPRMWSLQLTAEGDSIHAGSLDTLFSFRTGFADLEVGPEGNIYLVNGPYSASRILRLRPVPPEFTSNPPDTGRQGVEFVYHPSFRGTPPVVSVVDGPEGMTVDTTTWSVHWIPSNADALRGTNTVTIRGSNGAGSVDQTFTVQVANVNDPPTAFGLLEPAGDALLTYVGSSPIVTFRWQSTTDPDLDTVRYRFQVDTLGVFAGPTLVDTLVGTSDSVRVQLPRTSRQYLWRVTATDGRLVTVSSPPARQLAVAYLPPFGTKEEKEFQKGVALEQNFPNPFNPVTSIQYVIHAAGHVRLSVFNLLGQEVARIYDGEQAEGTYEVEFNKLNLPSGIYFYRIQAPGLDETKKMVITK